MRCVFALTAMGFVPDPPSADEIVRIRVLPAWLRIDARFGSVFRRRAIRRWCCDEEQRRTPVILEGARGAARSRTSRWDRTYAPLWHFGVVVALLGGWTALALIFTSWTWILLWPFKADDTKKHASDEEGRLWVVAGLILVGAVASLVGCGTLLKSDREWDWLAVCSVALSWVTIHTLYALIYAKHFYDPLHRGGIDFNSPEGTGTDPVSKTSSMSLCHRDELRHTGHQSDVDPDAVDRVGAGRVVLPFRRRHHRLSGERARFRPG